MSVVSLCSLLFCAVLCVCFCTGHFVRVSFNLTCLNCWQHFSLNTLSIYIRYLYFLYMCMYTHFFKTLNVVNAFCFCTLYLVLQKCHICIRVIQWQYPECCFIHITRYVCFNLVCHVRAFVVHSTRQLALRLAVQFLI